MKRYKILLVKILLTVLVNGSANAKTHLISDIPLTWKDFTIKEGFRNHPYSAKIYTQLLPWRYEVKNGRIAFEMELKVDRDKSWVKKEFLEKEGKAMKQDLLDHEKGHLIIALINLRKMGNALNGFAYTRNYKKEIDSISRSFISELQLLNETYDNETNHMLVTEKQKQWINDLLVQLNELYTDEKISMKYNVQIALNF